MPMSIATPPCSTRWLPRCDKPPISLRKGRRVSIGSLAGRRRSAADADADGRQLARKVGRQIRQARLPAGLSQGAVARAASISQPRVSNLERGVARGGSLAELSVVARVVGLKLAVTCHPVLDPLRDSPQRSLVEALCVRLPPTVRWRTEVPMPIPDDLRAVDAVIAAGGIRVAVEAWTRLEDVQHRSARPSSSAEISGRSGW